MLLILLIRRAIKQLILLMLTYFKEECNGDCILLYLADLVWLFFENIDIVYENCTSIEQYFQRKHVTERCVNFIPEPKCFQSAIEKCKCLEYA